MNDLRLEECFDVIDADNGGTITIDEFKAFNIAQVKPLSSDALKKVFAEVDADGSGEVDKDEFKELVHKMEEVNGVSIDEMADAFERRCYEDLFSLVGDGAKALNSQELRNMVDSVNETLKLGHTGEDIRKVFKSCDEDGSGLIELEEFEYVMTAIKKRARISTLLWAFNEYKKAARARMNRFKAAFGCDEAETRRSPKAQPRTPAEPRSPTCPHCAKYKSRIAELEAKLEKMNEVNADLESQLDAAQAKAMQLEMEVREAQREMQKAVKAALNSPRRAPKKKEECPPWWEITFEDMKAKYDIARKALSVRTSALNMLMNRLKAQEYKSVSQHHMWATSLDVEIMKASLSLMRKEIDPLLRTNRIELEHVPLNPCESYRYDKPTGVVAAQQPIAASVRSSTASPAFRVPGLDARPGLGKHDLAFCSMRSLTPGRS